MPPPLPPVTLPHTRPIVVAASARYPHPTRTPLPSPLSATLTLRYAYYKKYGHEQTICMPASWRPSRSTPGDGVAEHAVDEIIALAGVDRMTIPPPLLQQLASVETPLPRLLETAAAAESCADSLVGGGDVSESDFRMMLNADVCATTKMAEGINAFVGETLKLEAALKAKLS